MVRNGKARREIGKLSKKEIKIHKKTRIFILINVKKIIKKE